MAIRSDFEDGLVPAGLDGAYEGIIPAAPDQPILVAQAAPATITIQLEDGNIARLPEGTSILDVKADGLDLVFTQPDGTVVVVEGGAITTLILFIGDIEIPAETIALMFSDNGIEPAEGPAGGEPDGTGSYVDMGSQTVGGEGRSNSTLGNTDLPEGEADEQEQQNAGNSPPIFKSVGFFGAVSEEGLFGANDDVTPLGIDTTNDVTFTVTFDAFDPDGDPLDYTFAGEPAPGLKSGTQLIEWDLSADGKTLFGTIDNGNELVIEAVITGDQAVITLHGPVDHLDPLSEDLASLILPVQVSDGFNPPVGATITLVMEDDSPEAGLTPKSSEINEPTPVTDETAQSSQGIALTPLVDFGADGPHAVTPFALETFTAVNFGALESNNVQVTIESDGTTLTGNAGGATVFTVQIVNGEAVLTLSAGLDNFDGDPVLLDFSSFIVATDGDGDHITLDAKQVVFAATDTGITHTSTSTSLLADGDDIVGASGAVGGPGDDEQTLSGTIAYTLGADPLASIALSADTSGLTTHADKPVETFWDAINNQLIGYAGNNQADVVFTITLTGIGSTVDAANTATYTIVLLQPLKHPGDDGNDTTFEDNLSFTVNALLTDADGSTATTSFNVSIDDDSPNAVPDNAQSATGDHTAIEGESIQQNLILAFDRSGSMSDDANGNAAGNQTRLELAKAGAVSLIQSSDAVLVLIVTFSDSATAQTWMTAQQAIAYINGNDFPGPNGGTDYDDALTAIMNGYNTNTPAGDTTVYFFTDGEPGGGGDGVNDDEEDVWNAFLAAKGIESYAVGVGTGLGTIVNDVDMLDVAQPDAGHIIELTNSSGGSSALLATAPQTSAAASGNVLTDGTDDAFGADGPAAGGGIVSITVGVDVYAYNATTGAITKNGGSFASSGGTLEVNTALGGHLTFHFVAGSGYAAGDYAYYSPANVDATTAETFTYKIADRDGDTAQADLTIDVLAKPTLSIGDIQINEDAGTATFTITLTGKLVSGPVSFQAQTADGTAVDGISENGAGTDDYTAKTQTITFSDAMAVTQTQTVTVNIGNDTVYENTENFFLNLIGVDPTKVDVAHSDLQAKATIIENDAPPTLTISSPTATEGSGGTDDLNFVLTLSHASQAPITLVLKTQNGTAVANGDYDSDTFTVTFAPGETTKTVVLDTNNDDLDEPSETVILQVDSVSAGTIANPAASGTGTILDNDPMPSFSVNDRTVNENAGTITFTVTLSAASGQATSVNYAVSPGTATTPADYTGTLTGTLNFAAGETSKTIVLDIVNDALVEPSESFSVTLSGAVNATISDGSGTGTITDNDTPPTVTNVAVNDATLTDGDAGAGKFVVTVTFDQAMNTAAAPALTFNPVVGGALTSPNGVWSGGNTIYTVTYTVVDTNVNLSNITIDVTGAQDANGNPQANYTPQAEFSINTGAPPTASTVITAPGTLSYWSSTAEGDMTPINRISFQDPDSPGTVRITMTMNDTDDDFDAASSGDVTVTLSGGDFFGDEQQTITLDGTLAAINAYIAAGNILWNPTGITNGDGGTLSISVDDNGTAAGGNVTNLDIAIDEIATPNFSSASTNDFSGVNFNEIDTEPNAGNGADTIVTTWSHRPNGTETIYDGGGSSSDEITLVFQAAQLESILTSATNRGALDNLLDGDSTSLDLGSTTWNAQVLDFEEANLALAAGPTGYVAYTPATSSVGIPDHSGDNDVTGDHNDATADLVTGTSGNDAGIHGGIDFTDTADNGNDFLLGLGGNDVMWGGAGADLLLGGSGDDDLHGGNGNDVLSGGSGADDFFFSAIGGSAEDFITDYSFVEGDRVDLSTLLSGVTAANLFNYVDLSQSGSDVLVRVNAAGTGIFDSSHDTATLAGYNSGGADPVKLFIDGVEFIVTE